MGFQWWCAAQGTAWSWSWQPYPGVWAAMLALAWTGWRAWRWADADLARSRVGRRWRIAAFALGTIVLWAALDWPIGPLAAGYLASVHMAQFLIIALIVPPALLFGLPPADRPPNSRPSLRAGLRLVTHPLVAILLFNLVVVATHLPEVVDRSMRTQLGSFAIDVSWLLAGLILWWPVIRRFPERPGFSRPVKMGYLFVNMIPATVVAAFLVFAHYPAYELYELAPPGPWLSTGDDQRLAGLLMKFGGAVIHWVAITVLFILWYRDQADEPLEPGTAGAP